MNRDQKNVRMTLWSKVYGMAFQRRSQNVSIDQRTQLATIEADEAVRLFDERFIEDTAQEDAANG